MTKRFADLNTAILHSAHGYDEATGALSTPIYQVSTFRQETPEANGRYDYSRSNNPTREAFEETIAGLEGGDRGLAFASGMAAIGSTLLLLSPGDHIVVTQDCYGGTFRLLTRLMRRLQIEASFCDTDDLDAVSQSFRPNTKALYIETPSNPLMKITDITACAELAHAHGAIVIVDNTLLSPAVQRPLAHGADIVLHSATKFIGGHSDVIAGAAVVKGEELASELKFIQNAFGAVLGPQDSWLLLRGLKTLGIRVERQQATAQLLAEWLEAHPRVERVRYPGLPSHAGREVHFQQANGPGSLLSFEVDSEETATRVLSNLSICSLAVSLGAVETIVTYPKTQSHASVPEEDRARRGLKDTLIRVSVGLEGFEDLREDLARGLNLA